MAPGFSDGIAKVGTCGQVFGPFFGPKSAPGHAIHVKISYQYIHFFNFQKLAPNIFILRRCFFNILVPDFGCLLESSPL